MGSAMPHTRAFLRGSALPWFLSSVIVLGLVACKSHEERVLLKAEGLTRAGRPSEALQLLHSYLQRTPQAVELRRLKILVAIKAQRSKEALSDYGAVSDVERKHDPGLLHELALGLIDDALWSEEGLIRARAAAALAELADLSAHPLLQRGLEHPDPSVRAHAVETVGRLGNPALQPELEQRLNDSDPFVRAAAAWALGRLGQPSSQPLLRHRLLDRHAHVKVRAAGALLLLGDRSALPSLTGALEAKDAAVRIQAAEVLGHLLEPSARNPLERRRHQDTDLYVRLYAAEALAKIGDHEAVSYLRAAVSNGNGFLGLFAGELLSNLGDRSAVPFLKAALADHADVRMRLYAAWTLGRFGDRSGLQSAEEVLKHPDPQLRANAAWTLGEIGGEEAMSLLKTVLRDEITTVKMHAIWALDRIVRSRGKTPTASTTSKLS